MARVSPGFLTPEREEAIDVEVTLRTYGAFFLLERGRPMLYCYGLKAIPERLMDRAKRVREEIAWLLRER